MAFLISSGLLLLAISTGWEYGFYIFLRLEIFISSTIVAWGFYKSNITAWALIFGAIAFLFNPIAPIPGRSLVSIFVPIKKR